jgi:outer membrane receptor for ferric coprogen and ferric-rhodotorulic acid
MVKKSVLKTKFKINPKFLASLYLASLKNQFQPAFHAIDGICQYQLSKRIKASVTLHNMLNQKIFYERQYGVYSISESKITLNGRILIMGFQFDF